MLNTTHRRPAGAKVLIVSASAGGGHLRAAQALEVAFREVAPDVEVINIDALDYMFAPARRIYAGGYLAMISKAPRLWGYLYRMTDRDGVRSKTKQFFEFLQKVNSARFLRFVREVNPDHIICTHFLPANLLSLWKKKKGIGLRFSVVLTDFDVHRLWVNEGVEFYFVATPIMAWKLKKLSVEEGRVVPSGIPIHPVFARKEDCYSILRKFGLTGDGPILTILSGGFGVGQMDAVLEGIVHLGGNLQLISIAGRNRALKARVDSLRCPTGVKLVSLGFIDNMHEVMAVSDLLITKAGGLTVSEALAKGLPMIIAFPIPGQEARNGDYLLESGAALKAHDFVELEYKIRMLLDDPGRLRMMRQSAEAIGKPRAAYVVAETVLENLTD